MLTAGAVSRGVWLQVGGCYWCGCIQSVSLPVCIQSVSLPVCTQSVSLPVCIQSVSLPVCIQPVSLPVCIQPVSLPVCIQPVSLPVCIQSVSLPVCTRPQQGRQYETGIPGRGMNGHVVLREDSEDSVLRKVPAPILHASKCFTGISWISSRVPYISFIFYLFMWLLYLLHGRFYRQ